MTNASNTSIIADRSNHCLSVHSSLPSPRGWKNWIVSTSAKCLRSLSEEMASQWSGGVLSSIAFESRAFPVLPPYRKLTYKQSVVGGTLFPLRIVALAGDSFRTDSRRRWDRGKLQEKLIAKQKTGNSQFGVAWSIRWKVRFDRRDWNTVV